ncbi:MAG: hypothetical protein H7338_09885, partial [Candidatus Sericytochromatia bacterium]|nr:hypothetical protein [Candidatus Sericytochromatia bacterium]
VLPMPVVTAGPEASAREGRMACGDDGRCSALADGLCSVHRAIGWQPFRPCAQFPWHFVRVADGVDITAAFGCGAVGRSLGRPLAEETPALRRQVATVWADLPPVTPRVTLSASGASLDWATYRAVETALLACLADTARGGLDRRLDDACRWLAGLLEATIAEVPMPPKAVPMAPGRRPTDGGAADRLLQRLTIGAPPDLVTDRMLGGGHYTAWMAGAGDETASWLDEALLTRYLRAVLFRKPGLAEAGLAFVWGVVMLAAGLWVRDTTFRARQAGRVPDGAMQLETARLLDLTLLHSPWLTELAMHRPTRLAISDPAVWASLLVR